MELYASSSQQVVSSSLMYSCSVCGKLFMHRRTLKRHELIHSTTNSFTCMECGKQYSQAYDLERHSRSHRGDKPYTCQVCSRTFSMAHHLTNHMVTHTGVRAYSCLVCSKRFAQTFSLKRHMRMHLRLADVTSSASVPAASAAGFVVDGMALLRSLSCEQCGKVFSSQQTLKRHRCLSDPGPVRSHLPVSLQQVAGVPHGISVQRIHRCGECGAEFSTTRLLNEHVASVHRGQPSKPYACTECSKSFAHPYSLKRHRVEHGGDAHVCPTCNKRFAQLYELDRHLKSHRSDEKMVSCAVCSRRYIPNSFGGGHLVTPDGEKAPTCDSCMQAFGQTFGLKPSSETLENNADVSNGCE